MKKGSKAISNNTLKMKTQRNIIPAGLIWGNTVCIITRSDNNFVDDHWKWSKSDDTGP